MNRRSESRFRERTASGLASSTAIGRRCARRQTVRPTGRGAAAGVEVLGERNPILFPAPPGAPAGWGASGRGPRVSDSFPASQMRIGVPKETAAGEHRVALVPEVVSKLEAKGLDVLVQSGAGE